jgi:hypothetical protein
MGLGRFHRTISWLASDLPSIVDDPRRPVKAHRSKRFSRQPETSGPGETWHCPRSAGAIIMLTRAVDVIVGLLDRLEFLPDSMCYCADSLSISSSDSDRLPPG